MEKGYLDSVIENLKAEAPKSKFKSMGLGMLYGLDILPATIEEAIREDDFKFGAPDREFTFGAKACHALEELEKSPNKNYRTFGAIVAMPFSMISYMATPFVSLSNHLHKKRKSR